MGAGRDLDNLALLNLLKHPNIIELLATYKYHEKINLIFPLAEGGNLAEVLNKDLKSSPFKSDESLFTALAGISSAIENVHDFSRNDLDLPLVGCHHDLRPRNIFLDKGKLLLGDFGLSSFKHRSDDSRSMFKGGSDAYAAPECEDSDHDFQRSPVGRATDIWSFGCLIAEMCVHAQFDLSGLKRFRNERMFNKDGFILSCFHNGNSESPTVKEWLSKLESTNSKATAIVVKLIRRMLSLQQSERPKAGEVTAYLNLVSIYTVAESIDELFNELCRSVEHQEITLQMHRFGGWRVGQGLPHGTERSALPTFAALMVSLDFESTLKCLLDMRLCLTEVIHYETEAFASGSRRLKRLNDRLLKLLNDDQREVARISFLLSYSLSTSTDDSRDDPNFSGLDHETRCLISLKSMTELVNKHSVDQDADQRIDSKRISNQGEFGHYEIGDLNERDERKKVLIEWHGYASDEVRQGRLEELFNRLRSMVALLRLERPDEFCSLPCLGFFHDVESNYRFGVVYELFQGVPVTLQEFIESTADDPYRQPALEQIFALAYALAKALSAFHLVGWLHKNLSSQNVIFPSVKGRQSNPAIQEPCIVGLNHSRPNDPLAFTEGASDATSGDHQHPDYRQKGAAFERKYDYYSLGILLLEIGLWQTLNSLKSEDDEYDRCSAHELRQKLLESQVPLLRPSMGTSYCEAVKTCLTGNFDGINKNCIDSGDQKELVLSFKRLVLDPLRRLACIN